jgi:hypothetical protein
VDVFGSVMKIVACVHNESVISDTSEVSGMRTVAVK